MTRPARTLVNTDFSRLWLGQAVSQFGDVVSGTALMLWIAVVLLDGRPEAPAVSGAAILVATVAALAATPLAGVLADRWDTRRVMLGADLLRCAVTAALSVVLLLPVGTGARLAAVFAALVLNAVAAQFFAPAKVILLGDIVPEDRLGRAASYNQTAYAVVSIAGPAVAAVLVFGVGIGATLLLDAASFAVSWYAIRAIAPTATTRPAAGRPAVLAQFAGGLRTAARDRAVRGLLVAVGLAMTGCGAMTALSVYFVRYNLHAGGTWFGILESAAALGTVAGGLLCGRIAGERIGYRRLYGALLLAFGLLVLAYSRLSSPVPALVLSIGMGAALGGLNAAYTPLLITLVPRPELGRVSSLVNATSQAASLLSVAVFSGLVSAALHGSGSVGFLGLRFGAVDAVFAGCGLLCALAGTLTLRDRQAH